MSRRGRRAAPSEDELALWQAVAKTVAPLAKRRRAEPKPKTEPPVKEPQQEAPSRKPPSAPGTTVEKKAAKVPVPPSPTILDRRLRSRVSRGTVPIDCRIDLHGLTQAAAHARLRRFLHDAQADGRRIVLVITGKGRLSATSGEEDRGVLRRMVPIWLAAADMRPVVVGFEEAGRGHGGSGALYVHVRRRRSDADEDR